jgi:hypothetical protein
MSLADSRGNRFSSRSGSFWSEDEEREQLRYVGSLPPLITHKSEVLSSLLALLVWKEAETLPRGAEHRSQEGPNPSTAPCFKPHCNIDLQHSNIILVTQTAIATRD